MSPRRSVKSETTVIQIEAGTREVIGLAIGQRCTVASAGIVKVATLTSSAEVTAAHTLQSGACSRTFGPFTSYRYVSVESLAGPAQYEVW